MIRIESLEELEDAISKNENVLELNNRLVNRIIKIKFAEKLILIFTLFITVIGITISLKLGLGLLMGMGVSAALGSIIIAFALIFRGISIVSLNRFKYYEEIDKNSLFTVFRRKIGIDSEDSEFKRIGHL
jgi:hypothetical protein